MVDGRLALVRRMSRYRLVLLPLIARICRRLVLRAGSIVPRLSVNFVIFRILVLRRVCPAFDDGNRLCSHQTSRPFVVDRVSTWLHLRSVVWILYPARLSAPGLDQMVIVLLLLNIAGRV